MKKNDELVISHFRNNARMSLTKISKLTKIPVSTLFDKLRDLEGKSFIKKHTSILDFKKLGFDLRCFCLVKVKPDNKLNLQEYLMKLSKVNNLFRISNGNDFLIELVFKNLAELDNFNRNLEIFEIISKKEFFIMEDIKRESFFTYKKNLGVIGIE